VQSPATDAICKDCWNRAVDCFGTGKIFEQRAARYRWKINLLSYLGVGVPAIVGALAIAWGKDVLEGSNVLLVASILGIVQIAISIASLVQSWPTELDYSNESASANLKFAEEFKKLAETAQTPPTDLHSQANQLIALDQARSQQDSKKHVTEKELRWGHRRGLRQFRRECAGCNTIPIDLKSTKCGICGDF
jgi:mobilome CxxCx(11)CxxC protein